MIVRKVLLITSGIGGTEPLSRSPATLEIRKAARLPQVIQESGKPLYEAIVLTEAVADRELDWLGLELGQMAKAPRLFCLLTEQTKELRDNLSSQGLSYEGVLYLNPESLVTALDRADRAAGSANEEEASERTGWERTLIGESPSTRHIRQIIRLVAKRSCTVLITGESGTGKEVVARALHLASNRSGRPMVSVNCAAVPSTLLESEMFGFEKGAFTGAAQSRVGRFEQAHRSTMFLDEIGDMPLELQAKILRILQEREVQRIGGSSSTQVDIRVLAATNRDLNSEVTAGRFRHDLYFRLRVVPLHIPPLRERKEDIPHLADHFLEKICEREGIIGKQLGPGVTSHLTELAWPGNVRELEHAIERAIALSGERDVLDLCDFPPFCDVAPLHSQVATAPDLPRGGVDFERMIARLEKALIDDALLKAHGNKARAAQMLGLKRSTLVSKVKAFEMCAC